MNNKKEDVFQSQDIIKAKETVIEKQHLEKLRLANAELSELLNLEDNKILQQTATLPLK